MSEIPEELERWRTRRQGELTSPESWLGLVGLFWLEPVRNWVGSADDAIVRLPGKPASLGDLRLYGVCHLPAAAARDLAAVRRTGGREMAWRRLACQGLSTSCAGPGKFRSSVRLRRSRIQRPAPRRARRSTNGRSWPAHLARWPAFHGRGNPPAAGKNDALESTTQFKQPVVCLLHRPAGRCASPSARSAWSIFWPPRPFTGWPSRDCSSLTATRLLSPSMPSISPIS